jgi:hypothetical protein
MKKSTVGLDANSFTRTAQEGRIHSASKPIRRLICPSYLVRRRIASRMKASCLGRRGARDS